MLELCKNHKLVLAEDGLCVLCRRPDQPAVSTPEEGVLSRAFTGLLGVCLLIAIGELIAVSRLTPPPADDEYAVASTAAQPPQNTPLPTPVEQIAPDTAMMPAPPRPMFSRADATSSELKPTDVAVTMYTAQWCFICDQAHEFMVMRGVALTEIDIDRDRANMRRLAKHNPSMTIPTFEIDGHTQVGWNRWQLDAAIRDAAQQRYAARN